MSAPSRHESRFSLHDQVALVVGGTSGIGLAIAGGLCDAGATVCVAGRSADKLQHARARLRSGGHDVLGVQADVCDQDQLDALLGTVLQAHGRIDILVNSQGTTLIQPALDFTREGYDAVMDTNLRSVFFASLAVGRHMRERGSGSIVNIASLASFRGWPGSTVYGMSKFGVLSLTESLAGEWADRKVRVNAIAPGFFMTELNREKMKPERKHHALARTPMGRFGELEELVGAAVYLASPAASFVTGTTIPVDGGYLASGI